MYLVHLCYNGLDTVITLLGGIGIFLNRNFKVQNYQITSSKIPSGFDGCKIVFLTDLHSNTYGSDNIRLIQAIDKQKPNYIVITGDMIVGCKNFDGTIALQLLKTLSRKYKIVYAMGNHEQKAELFEESKEKFFTYKNELIRMGILFLDNQTISITRNGQAIYITGATIDLKYYSKVWKFVKMDQNYLTSVVGKANKKEYNILLAHNPNYFHQYAEWGADLVLSGHVHGGIVILPKLGGVIAPDYRLFPQYDSGVFEEKKSKMILSRGLGTHTIKFRMFNRPELSILVLNGKSL
jgi:Predicted phosphohydrolases